MCDCPQDRDEEPEDRPGGAGNRADLFAGCGATVYSGDPEERRTVLVLKQPFERGDGRTRETPTAASSECSSDSTRDYNFDVGPRFFSRGGEEATTPVSCGRCVAAEDGPEKEEDAEPDVECTLAMIKPEAMPCREAIEARIAEEGFEVWQTRWLQLTPEQASDFYADRYGRADFALLVAYISSGPVIAAVLAKRRAVEDWRHAMGPTKVAEARLYFPDSVRATFGRRRGEDFENVVHGSDSRERADREIRFFFPGIVLEPLLRGEAAADYLWQAINEVLLEGLTLCCKRKPADPVLWLANWLILNNPNKPKLPEDLAMLPT